MTKTGKFVISLDFELQWGVFDKETLESYKENILGAREALPKTLELFDKYDVVATFATVGFLFAVDKAMLTKYVPKDTPNYTDTKLSPYTTQIAQMKDSENEDPLHYAASLVKLIQKYPKQELATHTFSHYYCLEEGQTITDFRNDTQAAIDIAKVYDCELKSLVFPKNQFNESYLQVCKELGISSYRGNEKSWIYSAKSEEDQTLKKRASRLLDTYINLSGHNCATMEEIGATYPYNIPSSRFLRPYNPKLASVENLRLKRIKKSMTHAAKTGTVFHLWWHPHNFGVNQKENFQALTEVLEHYKRLRASYNFESITMKGIAEEISTKQKAL